MNCASRANSTARPAAHRRNVDTYDYVDESGELLFQVLRYNSEPRFSQRRPNGNSGWISAKGCMDGVRRVLYRLPQLIEGLASEHPVVILEGEKDVKTAARLGLVATTNAGGAGKWRDEYDAYFAGAEVIICPDNDPAGAKHQQDVVSHLLPIARRVRVVNVPDAKDLTAWVERGGTREAFDALLEGAPTASFEASPVVETRAALIQSSAEFVRDFVPPDYLIDGLLIRRFIYSITARTGGGKTAVALLFAASVALGRNIGKYEVSKGSVLYFAGENPTDAQMRWIALSQHMDFDVDTIDVAFVPGHFKFKDMIARITAEIKERGKLSLVVIDTSAAYFDGSDENDNVQLGDYARRLREALTKLPGGPTVLVACHPVKNAAPDNLLPRGGGAFVNEMDGNLTSVKDDGASTCEMHWQGKFRGPDFAPVTFLLKTVTHERIKDTKGRLLPTVIAEHLSEIAQDEMTNAARGNEDLLLAEIARDPRASQANLARKLGWLLRSGEPHKMKVKRAIGSLQTAKLVKQERGYIDVTDKGRKVLNGGTYAAQEDE